MADRLRITICTPALANSRLGNRVTAERWGAILSSLGHQVVITTSYDGQPADLLIAIHAWRSADAVAAFHRDYPDRPIVVCLSGTDIYAYQASHPETTLASLETATALIGLHDLVGRSLPERFIGKLRIIFQSAPAVMRQSCANDAFDICVIGHLREEKDPFRTAEASRRLPTSSRIRVTHVGRALDEVWAERARAEMTGNPRYRWLGEVGEDAVRALLSTTQLMVLSSIMEGGANVLGEAIASGVPVVTSAIDGSLGLLGLDFPGTYPVGDTQALANLLQRVEHDAAFLAMLTRWSEARAPLFTAKREQASWARLIAELGPIPTCSHHT